MPLAAPLHVPTQKNPQNIGQRRAKLVAITDYIGKCFSYQEIRNKNTIIYFTMRLFALLASVNIVAAQFEGNAFQRGNQKGFSKRKSKKAAVDFSQG